MAVNLEWDVAHEIVSPFGSLLLNAAVPGVLSSGRGALFLLKPSPYKILPAKLRPVSDSLSQADGSSLQPPFVDGLVAQLFVEFWVQAGSGNDPANVEPACAADLREMEELLTLHLNALRRYSDQPGSQQRLLWQPTGYGDRRMLTDILVAAWEDPAPFSGDGGAGMGMTFALATPFPYAIDATEIQTTITAGSYGAVANCGNAAQSPVIQVQGPTSAFVIENMETGQQVAYSGSLISGGHYAEIDFFKGTIFVDGAFADLIDGLDPTVTDFWLLGADTTTQVFAEGADILVKSNCAWI